MQDGYHHNLESVVRNTEKLEADLKKLGLKIKHHEDNLRFLKSQINSIDESILDKQVILSKHYIPHLPEEASDCVAHIQSEKQTIENILQQKKTAAGIICQLKIRHGLQAVKLPLTKDVLGVVATLGKVQDDNISRLLSEYLGLETMLAVVCKTFEGVKALEKYDKDGVIDKNAGLHGLGPSIGRHLEGRFFVYCLEKLRPYSGEFVADDPQKRLALLKPRLPNGACPAGFLGFAVNMFDLEHDHLSYLTSDGYGLRETLFYGLFSRLQVYKSRAEMELAIPFISDGAISLDGGMIRSSGHFCLGNRKDVEVRFPISSGKSSAPLEKVEIWEQLNLVNWKRERFAEDVQREEELLNDVRNSFNTKKEELEKCLMDTQHHVVQAQSISMRGSTMFGSFPT